ncbi:MAG TPA: ABC transporter permease [Streptosporangiaceae bacterium]|nr:ABC transporter permease [Streptosporangiaceae bacterium]
MNAVLAPGMVRLGLLRGRIEVKTFFRERLAVAFVFALPSILLVLLGSIFGNQATAQHISVGQLFSAGMIAGGLMSTSFQYLGINVAVERERGMLKRLYGTPMPRTAYFAGKLVQVLVCAVAETVLLVAVGMLFYHLRLPADAARWWTFAWIFLLGTFSCGLLGIAASSLPRSDTSAVPVITLPFTVLQFVSGVYVPYGSIPPWMRYIASVFPLKWMSQGLRSVFLPARAVALEPAGTWELGRIALVLGAWTVAGLILCTTTFRWLSRD